MGVGDWLRGLFGGRRPGREMVPFLDTEAGRVVRIPAAELSPGAIQVRLQETGEVVWALPEQLQTGQVQHPGWRVKELKLAAPPKGADEFVIQPAEVQVG